MYVIIKNFKYGQHFQYQTVGEFWYNFPDDYEIVIYCKLFSFT
jgi:hypothetical protein